MADPISEQIAANVLTRMKNITKANGYEQDLHPVRANRQLGNQVVDGRAIITEADNDIVGNPPQTMHQRSKVFSVDAYAVLSESDDRAYDTVLNKMEADIEKEIFTDTGWSDLAVDTELRGSQRFEEVNGDYVGVTVFFAVQYRTLDHDPYSQS